MRELARLGPHVGLVSIARSAESRDEVAALAQEGVELYLGTAPGTAGSARRGRRAPAPVRSAYRALSRASHRLKARGRPRDTVNLDGGLRDMAEAALDSFSSDRGMPWPSSRAPLGTSSTTFPAL
jgi:hypothetical protein